MNTSAPTIVDQFASTFGGVRRVPAWVLLAFVVLHVMLAHVLIAAPLRDVVALKLFVGSGGLLSYTALTFFVKLALLIGGLALVLGRLRLSDLGLRAGQLATAILVVLFGWTILQFVLAILGSAGGGGLQLNERLFTYSWKITAGSVIESAAAGAFFEEVAYRGFLLPQLYLVARRIWPGREMKAALVALSATQLFFALNHLPVGLELTTSAAGLFGYLTYIALGGLLFAMIYVVTGNLLIAVGLHALINNPVGMFASEIDPSLFCLIGAVVLLASWGRRHHGPEYARTSAAAPLRVALRPASGQHSEWPSSFLPLRMNARVVHWETAHTSSVGTRRPEPVPLLQNWINGSANTRDGHKQSKIDLILNSVAPSVGPVFWVPSAVTVKRLEY